MGQRSVGIVLTRAVHTQAMVAGLKVGDRVRCPAAKVLGEMGARRKYGKGWEHAYIGGTMRKRGPHRTVMIKFDGEPTAVEYNGYDE